MMSPVTHTAQNPNQFGCAGMAVCLFEFSVKE